MICRDCGEDNRSGRVYYGEWSGQPFRKRLEYNIGGGKMKTIKVKMKNGKEITFDNADNIVPIRKGDKIIIGFNEFDPEKIDFIKIDCGYKEMILKSDGRSAEVYKVERYGFKSEQEKLQESIGGIR